MFYANMFFPLYVILKLIKKLKNPILIFVLAVDPKCPFEYCGGESLFDGCQCYTSLDWAEDPSKVNAPICKRGDDFLKMLA